MEAGSRTLAHRSASSYQRAVTAASAAGSGPSGDAKSYERRYRRDQDATGERRKVERIAYGLFFPRRSRCGLFADARRHAQVPEQSLPERASQIGLARVLLEQSRFVPHNPAGAEVRGGALRGM